MSLEWASAVFGFVGAIIGGVCTLLGVQKQLKAGTAEQKRREDNHLTAILQALHDEIETLLEVYKSAIGVHIAALQTGQPFMYYWPVSSEYFSVYHSNAALIGHVKNNDLRKSIIQTYTYAKALIDSVRMNNVLLDKNQNSAFLAAQAQTEANKQIAQAHYQQLVQYSDVLKKSHERFERCVDDTLRSLRKTGVLSEQRR